jgi:hypothetical protein
MQERVNGPDSTESYVLQNTTEAVQAFHPRKSQPVLI